ncbi:MAG: hypothetical protein AMJ55_11760 [Gammaproteobacteria bacterium SG8_15]|nr:MAG: hypothetical protein AMJ55_11760 [Gammaproteobacteria bacterium SG8_15]
MLTTRLARYHENWFSIYYLIVLFSSSLLWHPNLRAEDQLQTVQYEITPYLWAASFSGTTAVSDDGSPPEPSPPIDSDYSFFSMDNLDGIASATFTARGQQWGFLFDFLYVAYEDTLEGRIFELAGSYQPASVNKLNVIAGLRRQDIDVTLNFLTLTPHATMDWVDPFIGVVYLPTLTDHWFLSLRGDIGGFGIESDSAINVEAMLSYQFGKTFSAKFGYRYLKVKFEDSTLVYDVSLDGFLFGLGIHF